MQFQNIVEVLYFKYSMQYLSFLLYFCIASLET